MSLSPETMASALQPPYSRNRVIIWDELSETRCAVACYDFPSASRRLRPDSPREL